MHFQHPYICCVIYLVSSTSPAVTKGVKMQKNKTWGPEYWTESEKKSTLKKKGGGGLVGFDEKRSCMTWSFPNVISFLFHFLLLLQLVQHPGTTALSLFLSFFEQGSRKIILSLLLTISKGKPHVEGERPDCNCSHKRHNGSVTLWEYILCERAMNTEHSIADSLSYYAANLLLWGQISHK